MGEFGLNEVFGILSVLITVVMFVFYIRDILSNKFKPHPFSWFLWLVITATIFLAQLTDGAGPGAWMNGVVTFFNLIIFTLSLKYRNSVIEKIDIVVLILAATAILLWIATSTPLYAVVLLSIALTLAYIPTLRKAYSKPYEESIYLFSLGLVRQALTILAMDNMTLVTILSPAVLIVDCIIVTSFILWRRYKVKP